MRKSLITTAVLGALAAPSFVFAADAAPVSNLTVAYNVGLYSQYIFRGLTQTDRKPALQGGVDLTHSSGFYLGAWGSNISWLRDKYGVGQTDEAETFYKSGGNLELDLYGGFRTELGKSGVGIDLGALQYWYPGSERGRSTGAGYAKANTTEVYGALSYGWLQGKVSVVTSDDAWGWGKTASVTKDASGTYYAELNATLPIGEWVGGGAFSGLTGIAHIARQEFNNNEVFLASYTDYKLGLQKAFENGVNVGAYWTDTNGAKNASWTYNGKNIGESTGTAYIQKTF
jgi:uncharacterized protein (TIGR02001 family)